jgi:hypothetical protein
VKSKDYSDRVNKEQACDVLVIKVNDKDANRDTAVKKQEVLGRTNRLLSLIPHGPH